jgi:hypothetical protein
MGCDDARLDCFGEALGGLALLPLGQVGDELLFGEVRRLAWRFYNLGANDKSVKGSGSRKTVFALAEKMPSRHAKRRDW